MKVKSMLILFLIFGLVCHTQAAEYDIDSGGRKDQNLKLEHIEFRNQPINQNVKSDGLLMKCSSPYQVMAGTVIPGVLVTGMNSDLPGTVIGQVSQNVYDTVSGKYLLIPQGSRIIGTYDSNTAYAQSRGAVIWQRLILPNGDSMVLPNFDGSDSEGYVGFKDKVRSHYARVVWSSLLGAAVVAGVGSATDSSDEDSFRSEMAAQSSTNITGAVNNIVNKNLNIAPTVIIRPGYKFNIIVNKDLTLKPYEDNE